MNGSKKVNPLHRGALTLEDVNAGDNIICWKPGDSNTTRRMTIVSSPCQDEDDTWVVDVSDIDGRVRTVPTSEVGLSGERYTGEWTLIAIRDEEIN